MRLHFQEKPWDLYVAVGYTAVMAALLLVLGIGNLIAILLPGHRQNHAQYYFVSFRRSS